MCDRSGETFNRPDDPTRDELAGVNQVLINLFRVLESFVDRAFGNFIKHHAEGSFCGPLGHDLFRQMLTNRFALAIRVSGEVDGICYFRCSL